MSLLPLLFDDVFTPRCSRRYHNLVDPEDFFPIRNSEALRCHLRNNLKHIDQDNSISLDKDTFQVNIDVQQFKPGEISVKLTGENVVTIEGKHEEKQDEHGFISRHFVRKYVLPEDCDAKRLQSKLSSDGVLSITAPKKMQKKTQYTEIPIIRTGEPVKRIEQNKGEGDAESQLKSNL